MKVQVNVTTIASKEAGTKYDLIVGESDTVASLKDRVAVLHLIPFPEQDLVFDGKVLQDGDKFGDVGLKDGTPASMDLVIKGSEETLAEQLKAFLQARDLSCDELGLLYCYKHGVNVSQALQCLGRSGEKLQDFLRRQKGFQVENNQVALVRKDTALKPFSVAEELEQILKASETGSMEVKELCAKFTAKFNIQFSSIAGMRALDFCAKEHERFVVTGRRFVGLRSASPKWPAAGRGAAGATAKLGPPPGLGLAKEAAPAAGEGPAKNLASTENQQYLDLHARVCGRAFVSGVQQTVNDVVELIQGATFLNVERVVRSGSVGKSTAIEGGADAEVVFFLPGVPPTTQERWLPPLLRSVGGVWAATLSEEKLIDDIAITEDCVRVTAEGGLTVAFRFSPVFGSYQQAIQALAAVARSPEARALLGASLTEERTQFIARQPNSVKVTIRLLEWWRNQQAWSSPKSRPSDAILELVAVYAAVQGKAQDQREAVIAAMQLLATFSRLRVTWSNYYKQGDVPAAILRQRPLLMDPVNPQLNVADPQTFDPAELMEAARTTKFFQ